MNAAHENVLVADLMTREVITCPPDADLAAVAATLARRSVHAVFVLDGDGQPAGVVSDFDLLAGEWLGTDAESLKTMQTVTAGELMTSPVETIASSAQASAAAKRMQELRLNRLLVVDDMGVPTGVISVGDLVAPVGEPSGERRVVRDVMSYAIVTCLPDTPVEGVARAMTERRSRAVVVVDDIGRAVGMITGKDFLSLYESDEHPASANELMRSPLIAVEPDAALAAAAEQMLRHEVHRLVVIDPSGVEGVPIGIVSTSDIVAEMAHAGSVWQGARP